MRLFSQESMTVAAIATALALGTATAANAAYLNGYQVIENFEGLDSSWNGVIDIDGIATTVNGGSVLTQGGDLDPRFPPASGLNVYGGQNIVVQLDDPVCCSYAAFGARVTGLGAVTLTTYYFDYALNIEQFYGAVTFAGGNFIGSGSGAPNTLLQIINGLPGAVLTRAEFTSSQWFTIDDLMLGLPDVIPGIPEPATWGMMIAGFGLLGVVMRRRALLVAQRLAGGGQCGA